MQAHLVKCAAGPDVVEEVIELYRRGGDFDTPCGGARLSDDFELGSFQRTATEKQRVVQRLFNPDIKPRINTSAEKLDREVVHHCQRNQRQNGKGADETQGQSRA